MIHANGSIESATLLRRKAGRFRGIAPMFYCLALWLMTLTAADAQTLADALDMPGAVWTTSGNSAWFGQAAITRDGVDAARSGAIGNNQRSSIQAVFQGPATLRYWRKISSEEGFDYLRVFIDDVEAGGAAITGEADWQQHALFLKPGSQTVRWSYIKDEIIGEGSDAAWLDQFTLVPADQGPPVIVRSPERTGAELGAAVVLECQAFGQAPLSFQWRKNAAPLAGETGSTLTLAGFSSAQAGSYDCVVTNDLGNAIADSAAVSLVSIGPAVDDQTRPWFAKGDLFWTPQNLITWDGVDALRSGAIGDDQVSSFEAVFEGPGTLTFRCRTSTEEDYDFLRVSVDGTVVKQMSGVTDWTLYSIALPAGQRKVRWTYAKNVRFVFGEDAVFVDQIQLATSYAGWRSAFFNAAELNDATISGPRADPNGNGIENGWEYVFGNDPKAVTEMVAPISKAQWWHPAGSGTGPAYRALRLVLPGSLPPDVTIEVQQSESLPPAPAWMTLARKTGNGAWTFSNRGAAEETPAGGRIEVIVYEDTPVVPDDAAPPKFMRAQVSITP